MNEDIEFNTYKWTKKAYNYIYMKWQVHQRLAGGDEHEGGINLEDEGGVKAEAVGEGEVRHLIEEGIF